MYAASNRPFGWRNTHDSKAENGEWQIQMVPLPVKTVRPPGFGSEQSVDWISATPFVPPGRRHRFRKNGKPRLGETPDALAVKLLKKSGFPPCTVNFVDECNHWVNVHESRNERRERRTETTRNSRRGYRLRITFDKTVGGPILIGHSSHFGLGAVLSDWHCRVTNPFWYPNSICCSVLAAIGRSTKPTGCS